MSIPDWYVLILLGLAAWRTFYLPQDDIMDPLIRYVTARGKTWKKEGDHLPKEYRNRLAEFLECPYCFGFWVALAWWGAWQIWPHGTEVVAVPFALSTLVIGVAGLLHAD